KRFNARAETMDHLDEVLMEADIVISSTGASQPILTKHRLQRLKKERKNKSLFLIDLAVQRDIEADVDELVRVYLYEFDYLQYVVDSNMKARKEATKMIESQ